MGATPITSIDPAGLAALTGLRCTSPFLGAAWLRASISTWSGHADVSSLDWPLANGGRAHALIGRRRQVRRGGLVRPMTIALNASMQDALDAVFIERNGFHGVPEDGFEDALDGFLDALEALPPWDELRLPGLSLAQVERVRTAVSGRGWRVSDEEIRPAYLLDLDAVRANGADFLASRSSNTRQQLRRARRQIEAALGPLRLEAAATASQALEWFDACAPLHRARWSAERGGSGFDLPGFVAFHRAMIGNDFGSVQLLRLSAGERVVAYLYNLVCDAYVGFYLSAIDYAVGDSYRPGMLAHWLAIEHHIAGGARTYDFLAGENRYKRSLSDTAYTQHWLTIRRPGLVLAAEHLGRRIKERLRATPAA
ncbi:MAG: GNAT family N-acetyltransferase [Burkholderiaceae bacterium]|nr:GNAT family N-acetyltransferase [Burkholderiaceae bacterium]